MDPSGKWANRFLRYFELVFLLLILEQILIDEEGLKGRKGTKLRNTREQQSRWKQEEVQRFFAEDSLAHVGNTKELWIWNTTIWGGGMRWETVAGRECRLQQNGQRGKQRNTPLYVAFKRWWEVF